MNKENWVPVKNFEKEYFVSNLGNIKSAWGKLLKQSPMKKYIRNKKELIEDIHKSSTLYVKLYRDKKQYNVSVGKTVARSFGLVTKDLIFRVQYKDFDTKNNCLENIKVVYINGPDPRLNDNEG